MATETLTYHCECGRCDGGERCLWDGPLAGMVVVEYMPAYLRSSHQAAGNKGIWPHNGAIRVAVERSCADRIVSEESNDGWARIVEGADPAKYTDSPTEGTEDDAGEENDR